MTPEARAAAYALAEHLWALADTYRVDVQADKVTARPRVLFHSHPLRPLAGATALVEELDGIVTRDTTVGTSAWLDGIVVWAGQDIEIGVFYEPEHPAQSEETGR